MAKFGRLVRFKNPAGEIYYGEVEEQDPSLESLLGTFVFTYSGRNPWSHDFQRTDAKEQIAQVSLYLFYLRSENGTVADENRF